MPHLSKRFESLPLYQLASIPARKRALVARGMDVIDLGAGDADLSPPAEAVEALRRSAGEPALGRYGFGMGNVPYREAVSRFMNRRFGLSFDPMTEVVPLLGSKEGIAHLALAYLENGDVAVIPEPGYLCYLGGTLLGEGEPYMVPITPRTNFLVEPDELPDDIVRRTRLLYLNYPNNPTAAIAPREYLQRIVRFCRDRDILLVFDNAYSEIAFDGYVPPSIFEMDGARDVAIEFHSLSKTYNMTGWRLGWSVANPEISAALAKVKSFVDTGHFMAVQAAGAAALDAWETFVPRNVEMFHERRDAGVAAFRSAGFELEMPAATMYLWIQLPQNVNDATFAERLMEEHGVVVLAGTSFGAGGTGFFRVSLTTPPERLAEAARRAGELLQGWRS